jgi:GT2 family glycosyltransferase
MTRQLRHCASRTVIAVPVKDEADCLEACLAALTRQVNAAADEVLAFVNNSSDRSAAIARDVAVGSAVPIRVAETILPAGHAHAGGARQHAMRWAAERAGEHGILLCTDADGVVAPNWLAVNLMAIEAGAEAVAGRALIDPIDERRIPLPLRLADAQECQYAALLDEIDARLDADPADPWPRHDEHSGASIAVTAAAFRRADGMPFLEIGEDRAFFVQLRRVDTRIRHACEAVVTVSGRTDGRAAGGMADTIRRRMICADAFLDSRLEPARAAIARIVLRRRWRVLWRVGAASAPNLIAGLAADLHLPADFIAEVANYKYVGESWQMLEASSDRLRRRPVPATAVGEQIALAQGFLTSMDGPLAEQTA